MKYLVVARRALCLLGRLYVAGAWLTAAGACAYGGTRSACHAAAAVVVLGAASAVLAPLYLLARRLGRVA